MRTRLVCLLLLSVSICARAQGTQLWQQSSYASFEKGTPHGVAIFSDGRLEPSPPATQVLATSASFLWSATADKRGNVYLGTGSPAMVLKVAPDGTSTKLLETKDVSVQVVRIGPDGMLYAATLPDGKVYRIDPNGPPVKLADATAIFDSSKLDPKPTYIWDLAFDPAGRLYIATGGPAAIYRVDPKHPAAQPEKFFSSSEQHIRSLLFAKDGTLYAGSDGRGLVYRIGPDGKGFVLFEAPRQEIPAMAFDPAGNLYIAALGDKGRSALPPLAVHSAPTLTATIRIVSAGAAESSADSALVPNGTVIYQIAPDGTPRQLWGSTHDVVYALAWQQNSARGGPFDDSGLLVGSGNQGHLYRIATDGTYADLAHLEAIQATAFATHGSTLYVATSNIGKLYKLAATADDNPTYVSQVHDAKFFSQWGQAQVRGSGKYDLFARVGNIEQPTEGWNDWQQVTPGTSAPHLPKDSLPKARFLQWKAVLHRGASLNDVGFYYLPQNVAPVVDQIVLRLHTRVPPGANGEGQTTPVAINFPPSAAEPTYQIESSSSSPLMALPARNWATLRWKAHDDNGDHLRYSVQYRGDDEANWLPLESNIHETYTSFDLTRIPDGGYTLRVTASDAPSNPAGEALTGYEDSEHFLLNTTPPMLSPLQVTLADGSIHIAFNAQAKLSTISQAWYSIDAAPWQYMEPTNHLSDSLSEHYDTTIPLPKQDAAKSQQHTIAVRVIDRSGNAATEKSVVE
jgi:sugar lactone lactonase YvrE